jgi:cyanophycinase-like exopeptidase
LNQLNQVNQLNCYLLCIRSYFSVVIDILHRFADLAGGLAAPIVVIPTAGEQLRPLTTHPLHRHGFSNLVQLHTKDRAEADSDAFLAPLRAARGVFIDGGRQWRLVDSYLGTKTQRELENLLARGGVIAGTSAGATIQGVRFRLVTVS